MFLFSHCKRLPMEGSSPSALITSGKADHACSHCQRESDLCPGRPPSTHLTRCCRSLTWAPQPGHSSRHPRVRMNWESPLSCSEKLAGRDCKAPFWGSFESSSLISALYVRPCVGMWVLKVFSEMSPSSLNSSKTWILGGILVRSEYCWGSR